MTIALGIDVAEARKGLDVVALDGDLRVVLVQRGATVADVVAAVDALTPDVVCIDSPPAWATDRPTRSAERALRRLGITAFSTPTDPGDHPFYRWMRAGFAVFDAVADRYPRYRAGDVRGTAAEVFPEATAVLLAGHLRSTDEPKVAFRRRQLEQQGVATAKLRSADAVDAALAALTGILALTGRSAALGDPNEGVVLVPGPSLPSGPLRRQVVDPASQPTVLASQDLERQCLCGCGAAVRRRFLPGHDAKLKSRLRSAVADGRAAEARLRELGWD